MIYFENAMWGTEGFNTHLMAYTLCLSLSNFLERDFYFDYELPSSTPPEFAQKGEHKDKFRILMESRRSKVSELLDMPSRRRFEIDRNCENKIKLEVLTSRFLTTEEIKNKYSGSFIWESFAVGRICLVKEELQSYDLIENTHACLVNPSYFYFLNRKDKNELLKSVRIRYLEEIENLAKKIIDELGQYNSIHLRLGDFLQDKRGEGYSLDPDRFKKYLQANFPDDGLPILIATDGLNQKEIFFELLPEKKLIFIDELVFENYLDEFKKFKFTDFNALTIINQLICAGAENFIGTYRSTFTSIIQRLRQERGKKEDFYFFPDEKVAKLLSPDHKLVPDRQGFFDWNRYSIFSEEHHHMGWMREWKFELTSLDL